MSRQHLNLREFFGIAKEVFQESSTTDKIKIVGGSLVLAGVVAGALGYGPLQERYDLERYNAGADMPFSSTIDSGAILEEKVRSTTRDVLMGDNNMSAARWAISRGKDATELARIAMQSPEGQRGIFDIPGVDAALAEHANATLKDAPLMMRPGAFGTGFSLNPLEAMTDTVSGEQRDSIRARTVWHERAAEQHMVAGDVDKARAEALTALRGVTILSRGGLAAFKEGPEVLKGVPTVDRVAQHGESR